MEETASLPVPDACTEVQLEEIRAHLKEMGADEVLSGLRFARNRRRAREAGVLKVGRKSIVRSETHSVTAEQAQWRLKNWTLMAASYRKRGYSAPTISRIKKILEKKVRGLGQL